MTSRRTTALACVLLVGASLALTACESPSKEEQGRKDPAREGLALELGGVEYNVFITRQLNPSIPPDQDYVKGGEAPPGQALYGVFLQACNTGKKPTQSARDFKVVDNQGNEFLPKELPEDNAFAYHSRLLGPSQCIPQEGSVAQLGPTAGSMLLFQFPLTDTENRPLELEVEGPFDIAKQRREKLTFQLDL
jgi:hypothetical protein